MPRVGLTTDRLVEAAAELADEVGFDNVSISALARRFGVKDASLYSHVRSLRELRTRLALLVGGEMIDRIAVAVVGLAGKEALVAFSGAYREYALRHPGRYAATQIRIDQEIDRELAAESPLRAGPPRSPTGCSAPTTSTNLTSPTPSACCAAPSRVLHAGGRRRLRCAPGRAAVVGQGDRRPAHGPDPLAARDGPRRRR